MSTATRAQIEANRRNAKKSTGPRTNEGKAAVHLNALRHGLCSHIPLMHHEAEDETIPLLEALRDENQPVGANEEILVYQMAEHFYFQRRAGLLLAEELNYRDDGDKVLGDLSLLLRYHTTACRGFSKALADLRKLQKERILQEIGFVSQNAGEEEAYPDAAVIQEPATLPEPPISPAPASAEPQTSPVAPPQRQSAVEPTAATTAGSREIVQKPLSTHPRTPPRAA